MKAGGLKEKELRALATCANCRRKIGQTELPIFYVVTIERHGLDSRAINRQQGLAMMLGNNGLIANIMGPDEDMTVRLMEPRRIMICEDCSQKPMHFMNVALGGKETEAP